MGSSENFFEHVPIKIQEIKYFFRQGSKTMQKKVAVVLAGSGVYDGSEINEVVLTSLALEKNNLKPVFFAPNIEAPVVDHLTGDPVDATRNVLVESARMVRGHVQDLTQLQVEAFDALVVPGGFGVAKNLSDFASTGANFTLLPAFERIAMAFRDAGKAAAYLCIAPALLPKIYPNIACTVGKDLFIDGVIMQLGGQAIETSVDACCVDRHHRVVSTAAYMSAENLVQVQAGIEATITELTVLLAAEVLEKTA
jgi:enhancing lycopene biosynthesis protein 2